jgi:hypothetical protein
MIVRLEQYELNMAMFVGGERQQSARKKKSSNIYANRQENADEALTKHIMGACAEMAVAKLLNRYWSASVDTYTRGADVGKVIQVRWRSKDHYRLIVRPHDKEEHFYFLVRGRAPEFNVVGFIRGKDAKRQEWYEEHGGYAGAYFVPDKALREPRA